jgi:hypothetical protein
MILGSTLIAFHAGNAAADAFGDCRGGGDDSVKFTGCSQIINDKSSNADFLDVAYSTRGQIHCRRGDSAAASHDFEQKPRASQWVLRRAGLYSGTISDSFTAESKTALAAWIAKRCAQ